MRIEFETGPLFSYQDHHMLLLTPAGTFALRTTWHTGGGKTQLDVSREVLVVPAQTYTANCVAVGRGLTGAVAGEGARFIITAHGPSSALSTP